MVGITRSKVFFFFNDTATTEIYTLSLHDALPIYLNHAASYLIHAASYLNHAASHLSHAASYLSHSASYLSLAASY